MTNKLIEDIKSEEGYRRFPYRCTEGKLTIGYGFNLDDVGLSKEECDAVLDIRVKNLKSKVNSTLYYLEIEDEAWDILYSMAYQVGLAGLLKFKRMILALSIGDYKEAAKEGRDSLWYNQTTDRAERLMKKMEGIK